MRLIRKLLDILGMVISGIMVALLMLMTLLMFAQVAGRYLFHNGIFWAEEMARFAMVAMVFLGAGMACKYKDHIRVTILDEFLKGTARKIYRIIIALISIGFLSVLAFYGFFVLPIVSTQISANMQLPMHLIYMVIPIGAIIMILYLAVEIIDILFSQNNGDGV
jgi:TRAP-type C4-dicarboxylate transport system permease small subunit